MLRARDAAVEAIEAVGAWPARVLNYDAEWRVRRSRDLSEVARDVEDRDLHRVERAVAVQVAVAVVPRGMVDAGVNPPGGVWVALLLAVAAVLAVGAWRAVPRLVAHAVALKAARVLTPKRQHAVALLAGLAIRAICAGQALGADGRLVAGAIVG